MAEDNTGTKTGGAVESYIESIGGGYIKNFANFFMESMLDSVKMFQHSIEFQNQQFQAYMEKARTVLENSMATMVAGVSKTANEIGSQALKQRMSEARANIKAKVQEIQSQKQFEIERTRIVNSLTKQVNKTASDFAKANIKLVGSIGSFTGSVLGKSESGTISTIGKAVEVISGAAGLVNAGVETFETLLDKGMEFSVERMEADKKLYEKAGEQLESILTTAEKAVNDFMSLADTVRHTAEENDKVSHAQGVQMGFYGTQGDYYAHAMMKTAEEVSEKFERKTEDLINMQKAYISESTRNVQLSARDYQNIVGTGRAFGMSDSETATMFGSMNLFNASIESGSDMLSDMYKTVTKMGLSSNKFAKDLQNNLKLAQKYNFKGGLENMMKMTQWAEQTRLNMSSTASFAEKFLSGSISDALETSARLQVLGGSAAIYSDPIAMLYEAGADMGSLMRRQAAMFNDIIGTFDEKTGQTTFSWYENMMIKQRAQAAGLSEDEAKNMIRQNRKQNVVDKILRGSGLSDEDMVAVGNRATFNERSGQWEVTDIYNQKHNIEELKYNKNLLKSLMPEDKTDALIDIAQRSLGFSEQQTRYQAYLANRLGAENYQDIVKISNRMLASTQEFYTNMEGFNNRNLKYVWNAQADAIRQQQQDSLLNSGNYEKIIRGFVDISNSLSRVDGQKLSEIAAMFDHIQSYEHTAKGVIDAAYDYVKANTPSYELFSYSKLMENSVDNLTSYFNEINSFLIPEIIDKSRSLTSEAETLTKTFANLGYKIASGAGNEMVTNLGVDALEAQLPYTLKYGKQVFDTADMVTEKVFDDLVGQLKKMFNGLLEGIDKKIDVIKEKVSGIFGNEDSQTAYIQQPNISNGQNGNLAYNTPTQGSKTENRVAHGTGLENRAVSQNGNLAYNAQTQHPGTETPVIHSTHPSANETSPIPMASINTNIGEIGNAVNLIAEMIKRGGNTSGTISLDNKITLENNASADQIKNAIIAALQSDPNFSRDISNMVSKNNEMAYNLSGNNTSQTI